MTENYYGIDRVIAICRERINVDDLLRTATTNTICLDGTSCTKKTSILNASGRVVTKVQQYNQCHNPDTFFPSMIGYISAGLIEMSNNPQPHYNDRSPLNVLDWYILWHAMDKFVVRFGNVRIDVAKKPTHAEFVDELIDIFNKYRTIYYRCALNSNITCIAMVDSNIDRADMLRYERCQGSDAQRSTWKFYTQLQNIMYTTLYPDRHIDLAWFDGCPGVDTNTVVQGVVSFLNDTLDKMGERPANKLSTFYPQCKLPTIRTDYTLNNNHVHTQRAVGRWSCKILASTALTDTTLPPPNEILFSDMIPKHLYVDNVYNPCTGERLPPILPHTRHELLAADPIDDEDDDISINVDKIDDDDEMYDFSQ